ncbi:MAG TPA: hypothetical protein VFD49_09110 [Candidatus Dormibacteraeota bacterium]|nr:hypothetical protein [Candidatus Dormibacteraeota bacterium]
MRLLDIYEAPDPGQLVADVRAAGYDGAAGYTANWSLLGTPWTPAHAAALRQAGLIFLPIVVPGNQPPPPEASWGWWDGQGPIELDLEPGSEPPITWVAAWIAVVRHRGGSPGLYAPAAQQVTYGGADWDWRCLADWTYVEPAAPPAPYQAVQWTNQLWIDGRRYDAGVYADEVFLPMAQLDQILSLTQAINDRTGQLWNLLDWGNPAGGDVPQGWMPTVLARVAQAVGIDPASVGNKVPAPGQGEAIELLRQLLQASVPGDLSQLAQDVADLKAAVQRIETALRGA